MPKPNHFYAVRSQNPPFKAPVAVFRLDLGEMTEQIDGQEHCRQVGQKSVGKDWDED